MKLNYFLNKNHIDKFKKDGYVICRDLFKLGTIKKIISSVKQIEKYQNVNGKWMKYYDISLKNKKKNILTRIENFYDYHTEIKKIFSDRHFKAQLKKIAGDNVVLFKDKINFKNPGAEGFKPHQDATIWKNMYGIKTFITIAVAIDKSTLKTGSLIQT